VRTLEGTRPNIDARFRAATAVCFTSVHFRQNQHLVQQVPRSRKQQAQKTSAAFLRSTFRFSAAQWEEVVMNITSIRGMTVRRVTSSRLQWSPEGVDHSAWEYFARTRPPPRSAGYAQTPIVVNHDTRTLTSISPPDYACRKPLPQSLAPRKAISSDDKINFQLNLCE